MHEEDKDKPETGKDQENTAPTDDASQSGEPDIMSDEERAEFYAAVRETFGDAKEIELDPDLAVGPTDHHESDDDTPQYPPEPADYDPEYIAGTYGGEAPINDPEPGHFFVDPEEVDEIAVAARCATYPLNDSGNGARFAEYMGSSAMFVPRVGYHTWDGKRWLIDPDAIKVLGMAEEIQRLMLREIPHVALEEWEIREIDAEPGLRAELARLESKELKDRSPEEKSRVETVDRRLVWIRKLKDKRASVKSAHRNFAKTSGNVSRLEAMLKTSTTRISVDVDDLDADPLTINCQNGILRFHVDEGEPGAEFSRVATVKLEPHERVVKRGDSDKPQYMTKLVAAEYDPEAKAPLFDKFVERVLPDPETRDFVQRWFGLSFLGIAGEQKFAFFYGGGANGKSVLVDLMASLAGDYAATARIESLTGKNRRGGGDATPDLMPLVGARMVRASEPEEGERLQEATIKELTGGESILVRNLNAGFIEVKPIFKLTISGNYKPEIRGTDDGIWRRVLLVLFNVQIPEKERDKKLGEKLLAERNGVFRWIVEGALDYLESGLQEPESVTSATEEYRAQSDPIRTFLNEECLCTGVPEDFKSGRDLSDGFNLWLDLRGQGRWTARTASNKLIAQAEHYRDPITGHTFTKGKSGVTGYRGIKFNDTFQRQFDEAPRDNQGHPIAGGGRSSGSGY